MDHKTLLRSMEYATRRSFMTAAAKACLGVSVLAMPSIVRAAEEQAAAAAGAARGAGKAKSVIYLYMAGGMSHIDTWDPKPGTEGAGEFEPIKTSAPDILIGEHLPLMAKQMDQCALIRSLNSKVGEHQRANYMMHTGYLPLGTARHPGLGPWVLRLGGRTNNNLPGSVIVGRGGLGSGSGFLGTEYEPLMIGKAQDGLANINRPGMVTEEQFEQRMALLDKLDAEFRKTYRTRGVQGYNEFYDEARRMMHSTDVEAFNLSKEDEATREKYGSDPFGQGCLLARRLVQHGVRFVEVALGGWDTHADNFDRVEELCNKLDKGMAALIADLRERGLLESTLVVLTTEFGRTPRINADRNNGRDHHPKAFSGILAGGGIKGGQVWGKSDKAGNNVDTDGVSIPDFNSTIAYALGVDHEKKLKAKDGRPFTLGNEGKPLVKLF